ncbi:hypothetical protein RB195_002191 [Necator americanus]|uniref:Globin domain-containing protein n=1 Tax=Necator americanus TaxID=51031 RepID=A0ABR1DHU4_NECAM
MDHCKTICCGPGYASPKEATKGPREKVLFVTCAHTNPDGHDMFVAIDVDPNSKTFCQILSRVVFPNKGDEVHHSGWNACSSCYDKPSAKRTHIVLPCLNSSRIYIINVENERDIRLEKTIEPAQLFKYGVSFPHTSHCLADGSIMISTLGDAHGNHKGNFILLDGRTFEPKGCWLDEARSVAFNYDFWYQPRRDVMISTEWGTPNSIKQGFVPSDVANGLYGRSVHLFKWSTHEKLQTIELPMEDGATPLEVRFKHEPSSPHAFVGTALGSSLFLLSPKIEVEGWLLPEMPSLITDILISMDDRFLYVSNWIHGDIRQYDITDPENIRLNGQIFLGGSIHEESGVKVLDDEELKKPPAACYVKGRRVEGGPQMLQLSLDGRRLYVTTSLYRKWDEQFYPGLVRTGALMLHVDVDNNGEDLFLDTRCAIPEAIAPPTFGSKSIISLCGKVKFTQHNAPTGTSTATQSSFEVYEMVAPPDVKRCTVASLSRCEVGKTPDKIQHGKDIYKYLFSRYPEIRNYYKGAENFTTEDVQNSERFEKLGTSVLLYIHLLANTYDNEHVFRALCREIMDKHKTRGIEPTWWKAFFDMFPAFLETKGAALSDEDKEAWIVLGVRFNDECQEHLTHLGLPHL